MEDPRRPEIDRPLDPQGLLSFYLVPLVILFLTLSLSGCSSNPSPSTPSSPSSPPSPSILQITLIQSLTGEGCLQLAKSHPTSIPTGLADLSAAQSALSAGTFTYSDVLNLALTHVKVDPQAMILVQPALTAIESQLGPQGGTLLPVKGTNAYNAIQAGIAGCQTGLVVGQGSAK